jgi:hypothetical protein
MKRALLGLSVLATVALAGCSCGNVNPEAPTRISQDSGTSIPAPDAGAPDAGGPGSLTLNAGGDLKFCAGGAAVIGPAAQPGYSYRWTPSTGLSGASLAQPTASPAQTTRYRVDATAPNGARGSASVLVTVWPNPTVDPIAAAVIEPGGSATITGSAQGGTPPYQFGWSSPDGTCGGPPCLSEATAASTEVAPPASTQLSLRVVDVNGCSASRHAQVTVLDPLAARVGPDRGICAGDSVTLGQAPVGGLAPYTFVWSSSDVACTSPGCIDDPSLQSPVLTPGQDTTFFEQVTDALGLQTEGSATLSVLPDPGVAGEDVYVVPGGSTQVGPAPITSATYAWGCNRVDCAISSTTAAQPLVFPARSTRYTLQASSGDGCEKESAATAWVELNAESAPRSGDAAFPVSAVLQVRFDQPMLESTFDPSRVQLIAADSGDLIPTTASYDPGTRTLTVRPPAPGTRGYSQGNDYTLTLTGGPGGVVSDDPILSNIFFGDWNLDFTTGAADTTPPTVVFRTPPAGASSAATNSALQATFDEALDPATVNASTFQLAGPAGGVQGAVSYDFESHTATFVPALPLDVSTAYAVTLAGVADLSGNLGGDAWTFTTGTGPDLTPPSVLAVSPVDGAVAVLSTATLSFTFSEPVYPGSFFGIRLIDETQGGEVGGTLAYDPLTQTATFTPSTMLAGGSTFALQVSGVQDLAGNAMSAPFVSHFTTMRTLFWDDFEHGTAKWSLPPNEAGVAWGTIVNAFSSPIHSLTDSPQGRFAPNVVSIAQTAAPIDVTGVSALVIEFAMRTRTQRKSDYFYLDYRVDGGTWVEIDRPGKAEGWNGNGPWVRWTLPVTPPAGSALDLRLRLVTDATKDRDGIYVDDVAVQAP